MRILTQKFTLFGFLKVEGKKMVLGVWTDRFCTKTVTLRDLSNTGVNLSIQLGVSVLCWGKSRNLNFFIFQHWILSLQIFGYSRANARRCETWRMMGCQLSIGGIVTLTNSILNSLPLFFSTYTTHTQKNNVMPWNNQYTL